MMMCVIVLNAELSDMHRAFWFSSPPLMYKFLTTLMPAVVDVFMLQMYYKKTLTS